MSFFLHYAPQGAFEDGIYVPYSSRKEAERQAAADLLAGMHAEALVGIFKAPYELPRGGWTHEQMHEAAVLPHQDPKQRTRVATAAAILKAAPAHQKALLAEEQAAHVAQALAIHEAVKAGVTVKTGLAEPKMSTPGEAYSVMTGGTATAGACALAAATAKTAVMVIAGATTAPSITQVAVSFDGVTASAVPVLVEMVTSTQGAAGTTTAQTPIQKRGWPASASISTAGQTYTAEPTTLTVVDKWLLSPNGGIVILQFPMGREPTGIITAAAAGKGYGIRLTAPAIVNVHVSVEFEE